MLRINPYGGESCEHAAGAAADCRCKQAS